MLIAWRRTQGPTDTLNRQIGDRSLATAAIFQRGGHSRPNARRTHRQLPRGHRRAPQLQPGPRRTGWLNLHGHKPERHAARRTTQGAQAGYRQHPRRHRGRPPPVPRAFPPRRRKRTLPCPSSSRSGSPTGRRRLADRRRQRQRARGRRLPPRARQKPRRCLKLPRAVLRAQRRGGLGTSRNCMRMIKPCWTSCPRKKTRALPIRPVVTA